MTGGKYTATRLGGQAAILLLSNLFTIVVGFPLGVYVARVLGAEKLGAFSLTEGAVAVAIGLLGLGLAPTLVRFIPEHLEEREYGCVRTLIRRGALILSALGASAYLTLALLLPAMERWWPPAAQHRWVILAMGLLIPVGLMSYFFQQGLRGFQEIRHMVLGSSVLQLTVKAALAVLLLSAGAGLMGYAAAVVGAGVFGTAWMFFGLRRSLSRLPRDGSEDCRDMASAWRRYAGIMYGNGLLGAGTGYLDRFLIGALSGAGPVGVLAVVKQLQLMPAVFLQMFLAVAAPMFAAAHARDDREQAAHLYHLTTDWVVRAAAPLLLFFGLFAEPMLALYGPEFVKLGRHALWILVAAQAANLAYGPLGNLLNMSGLEKLMLRLSVYKAALTTVGLVMLVPRFGLIGAALSIGIGIVVINTAASSVAKRRLGIGWWDARYLRWILPLVAASAFGLALSAYFRESADAFVLGVALVGLYAVFHGVSLMQGLHADDRELLSHIRAKLGLSQPG